MFNPWMPTLPDVLIFLSTLVCIVIAFFKYSFTYWSRNGIYFIPPSIPFGNNGPLIRLKITHGENARMFYKKFKELGLRYGGIYIFTKPVLVLVDPDLAKCVFLNDFQHFQSRGLYNNEEGDPLSAHLVSLDGVKWKNLRTKLTPTFTSGKIKAMFQTLINCSSGLEEILENHVKSNQAMDIKDIVGRFTTDIIGSCAFGIECNSLQNPENDFRKYSKMVFDLTPLQAFQVVCSNLFPKLFKFLKLKRNRSEVDDFFMNLVKRIVTYRETNHVQRNDFLQLLINIKNTGNVDSDGSKAEPGKSLTIEEIAAQSFIFFLAGFETSSTTITFFFYDLSLNQDIQDKVRTEINDVLGKYNGEITYDGIIEMHYLDMVINESMRLHAPIPLLQRRCTKDYKIPGTEDVIKEGVQVFIPVLGFQSDPEFYPEPEKFDPERFSNEEKKKRHPCTFLPFGEGPRNCIGLRFGLLQTKVGIIVLLRNHKFTLSSKTKTPIKLDPKNFIFSVEGGVWLNAEHV